MNKQLNERNKYIMKLEVGMYVRTKQGYIAKFKEYDEIFDVLRFETPIFLRSWMPCDYMQKERFVNRYFLKASHNIIDIIEVGDIVNYEQLNGGVVLNKKEDEIDTWYILPNTLKNEDIKSVITREQLKDLEYRLGDK